MQIKLHSGNRPRIANSRAWRCLKQFADIVNALNLATGKAEKKERNHLLGFFIQTQNVGAEHMLLMWLVLKTRLYIFAWDPPLLDWSTCARAETSKMNAVYKW